MKKLLLLSLSLLVSGIIFAQKEPKGSPSKAKSYIVKEDYVNAQAEIDKAITIEKYAGKQDTWVTRGQVYQAMALAGDESAVAIAMESYNKAKEIDPQSGWAKLADFQDIASFHGAFFNNAAEAYNAGDYDKSLMNFKMAMQVIPGDSLTMLNAVQAAFQADRTDEVLKLYDELIDSGMADDRTYQNAIILTKTETEDMDKAMSIIKKAQAAFPDNSQFRYEEINIYLETGREEEALSQLEEAVKKDPNNASIHSQLGQFKDNIAYNLMVDKKGTKHDLSSKKLKVTIPR